MGSLANILVIDDEKNICRSIQLLLEDENYLVWIETKPENACKIWESTPIDLVLLDIRMPVMDGFEILEQIFPLKIPVIIISGEASLDEAVHAIKNGAYDFITKPIHPDKLLISVKNALNHGQLSKKYSVLQEQAHKKYRIIGDSDYHHQLQQIIKKIAPTQGKVLILGESGTGKELVARAIHEASGRNGEFVKVNCAAIPEGLFETELFGHVKGAFTGAIQNYKGAFVQAQDGSLFLDEVGELPLNLQAKLLRTLQQNEVKPIGSQKQLTVNCRIIAATNRNLQEMVSQKTFREDLYYRLNVIPVHLKPLRELDGIIPQLIRLFINEFCIDNGFTNKDISSDAVDALEKYSWPGNIRELKNIIERLVILSGNIIDIGDIPEELFQSTYINTGLEGNITLSLKSFKQQQEKNYIVKLLNENDWNVSKVAKILQIERTYLHRKMTEYQIRDT